MPTEVTLLRASLPQSGASGQADAGGAGVLHVEPEAVHAAWRAGADHAPDALRQARGRLEDASGHALGDLSPATARAAGHVLGALDTALALVSETQQQLQGCLNDYNATDGASAGAFRALQGPAT